MSHGLQRRITAFRFGRGVSDAPIFWFRICGWGLHLRASKGYIPMFSERYGYTKALYLGPLRIQVLTPNA